MLAAALCGTALLASLAVPTALASDNGGQQIRLRDNCDPAGFPNNLCAPNHKGGIGLQQLLDFVHARPQHVLEQRNALGWRFSPDRTHVKLGTTLAVNNEGGETHTFTQVAAFHDLGCIPPFSLAMFGTPAVDPICPAPFVPPGPAVDPGGTLQVPLTQAGTFNFQCFIHPWMRTTITVEGKKS
jgi:plastocyanin